MRFYKDRAYVLVGVFDRNPKRYQWAVSQRLKGECIHPGDRVWVMTRYGAAVVTVVGIRKLREGEELPDKVATKLLDPKEPRINKYSPEARMVYEARKKKRMLKKQEKMKRGKKRNGKQGKNRNQGNRDRRQRNTSGE